METILQGLMELGGVTAAMVLDGAGRVVGHRGRAVYDRGTCEQAGGALQKAIESLQLQQEDWDAVTAQYADGKILLRRLVAASGAGRRHVLVVVADPTLNASFATVAIRVAANKLKAVIEGGAAELAASAPAPAAASAAAPAPASSATAPASPAPPAHSQVPPVLAYTGLSWSKASSAGASSAAAMSGVQVADAASSALLSRVTKELARHVGPMAKVYVQEAVRRVSPDVAFSLASRRALVADLAGQIEDPADRAQFEKALEKA